MPEGLVAMIGSWRRALSALRSPWGHREGAAPSPRPQTLARSPLSDKNLAPRPVGREALLQPGEVGMVHDCTTILALLGPLLGPGVLP